jgi:2-iminobutanoate/2-iminopropanoate deaminase
MAARRSIHIPGFSHRNPIPAASLKGNVLVSGGVHGIDPSTGGLAETLDEQCRHMFAHVRAILAEAGGRPDDIVSMTFWMSDRSQRPVLNKEWLDMFPDERSRPARHTMTAALEGAMLVQCAFMAVLGD